MRETESSLQQFAEFVLKARLVREHAAPYVVRWVRLFLQAPASEGSLAERARRFCADLDRQGSQDWQVRQAEHALRLYFVNFLQRRDWQRQPEPPADNGPRTVDPLTALEGFRQALRTRHYAYRTEISYVDWARRFFAYLSEGQHARHPHVDAAGVRDFATHLAVHRQVSASTQNQAVSAVLLLCRTVLGLDVDGFENTVRARRGHRLPVVLSVPETADLLDAMRGTTRLMAALIYGGGLRVSECCQLRVKDIDFDQSLIVVRSGKGDKDRTTLLAETVHDDLRLQLCSGERLHTADRQAGLAGVWLPEALERKYPNAGREPGWFWVFPSHTLSADPRAGIVRRHHISDSVVQKAVKDAAARANIHKPVSVHTLRHCFATHLLLNGVDIRQIQEYLGHAHVETTMIYTHVVKDLRNPATSPLDLLKRHAGGPHSHR